MVQNDFHVELAGDPQCGHDVVGPVGMGPQRHLMAQHLQYRIHAEVRRKFFGSLLFQIVARLLQGFANQIRRRHPGDRRFLFVAVHPARVLAKSDFQSRMSFQQHRFHGSLTCGFQHHALSADGIRAAWRDHHRGHAAGQRIIKSDIRRVNRVQRIHRRRHRAAGLVAVFGRPLGRFGIHAKMSVRVNQARRYDLACCIKNFATVRNRQ